MAQIKYEAFDESGKIYEFEQRKEGNSIFLTLKRSLFSGANKIYALKNISLAEAGESGYYIVPRTIQKNGDMQIFFKPRNDCQMVTKLPLMSFYGIKKQDFTCLVRVERNYNYAIVTKAENGRYSLCLLFDFTETDDIVAQNDVAHDDIRIEIVYLPLSADYNDMATLERNIRLSRGEIVTLKEKCAAKPAVEYARKYPLIRIRMGWKPSPSVVKHQTIENEPEMYTACTFKRVREIADALKKKGVAGAEIQLVGWNQSGHDGRFPQLFPADERLGGTEEFKKTIEYVKSLGYRISTHTNQIDSYEIANTFDWEDVCIKRNGEYNQVGDYGGGLSYHVCPVRQYKNAKRDLPALASYGENGLHFTDVVSIVVPDVCFSPLHPVSTADGIVYVQKVMEYTSGLFGGFSSEGCMDFALKYLDYGLYVTFGDGFGHSSNPIVDNYLPVWEVAYHGIVLYNPTSPTINYPIKKPEDRLTFIMRGGRPSLYLYSKFRTGGQKNWMGEDDLTCDTEKDLARTVSVVYESEKEYRELCDKQLLFMERYDILSDELHVAAYSDGSRIAGNFSNRKQIFEDREIAPYGYILLK